MHARLQVLLPVGTADRGPHLHLRWLARDNVLVQQEPLNRPNYWGGHQVWVLWLRMQYFHLKLVAHCVLHLGLHLLRFELLPDESWIARAEEGQLPS